MGEWGKSRVIPDEQHVYKKCTKRMKRRAESKRSGLNEKKNI